MEKKLKAVLFDFDGVVVDTEAQYTEFWRQVAGHYIPDIEDFAQKVKGQTLRNIYEKYLPDSELQAAVGRELVGFERTMRYDDVAGASEFVAAVRQAGMKTAVVTSSDLNKMNCVYAARPEMKSMFDSIFTAEDCRASKPSPECYITAAERLGVPIAECAIMEDSVNGLKSALASGAFVVGLSTTNSAEVVGRYADIVIPDFSCFTVSALESAFGACLRMNN